MSKEQTINDRAKIHTHYTIEDFDAKTGRLVNRQEFDHNCLLNEGITALLNLLGGIAETAFSEANARIGVGDSSTAAAAAQTGLQTAGANHFHQAMDVGYPQVANQTVTFRSTFAVGDAQFDWAEITVVNAATDAGDNLNRKVQAMGVKGAIQRVVTVAITIT
jgi:hypothetical protein